jgi:glycosyltransferase involved in cell wall biosynthesis
MMNVSIVIPCFNHADYLAEAIGSALAQTKPCEVIVVDDGSTDNSKAVADSFPVKVIAQVNKGLASARNTGIMNATGEAVLFLDADDILKPKAAERLSEVMTETGADIVASSFSCFGEYQDDVILECTPRLEDFREANRIGYCALVARAALLEVGGYSPRMTYGYEDLHLWFDLLKRGKKLVTVPDILWQYRTRRGSMIEAAQKHHAELMAQIYKDHPEARG